MDKYHTIFNTNSFKESANAGYSIRINDYCRGEIVRGKCTTRNRESVQGTGIGGKFLNTNGFKESATASYSI